MTARRTRRLLGLTTLVLTASLGLVAAGCGDDDPATSPVVTTAPDDAATADVATRATATLVVADVDRSIDFYRALGLDIPADSVYAIDGVSLHVTVHVSDGFDLDLDSIDATRLWDEDWEPATAGSRGLLNLHVPDRAAVDTLHGEIVAAGYASYTDPFDAHWGARYAVVTDPDGNLVGIMSADA